MRRAHLIAGLAGIAAFLLTGQVMEFHAPPMAQMPAEIRLMYRSRHLYILAGGLVNLLLGLHLAGVAAGWRRRLQQTGSILFLIAPVLLVLAFATEPEYGIAGRTWRSSLGLYALFGGGIAHLLSSPKDPKGR